MYSIIIPTFNRENITKSSVFTLLHLLKNTDLRYEIIVVNDGSTDGTENFFKKLAKENEKVRIVNTDKTKGTYRNPGFARNSGMKAAKGDVVCFCDGDILHLTDPLTPTDEIIKKSEGNCYITGIHYRLFGSRVEGPRGVGKDMPHGSWLAVKKTHIEEIGGYDQRFRRYGNEDQDIVQRLRRLGLKHYASEDIIAIHPSFDSERVDTNLNNISREVQLEIQREITVKRNEGLEWGRFFEPEVDRIYSPAVEAEKKKVEN